MPSHKVGEVGACQSNQNTEKECRRYNTISIVESARGYIVICVKLINIYSAWWPKLSEHLTYLKILTFFASKTLFNFIMFKKHADGCSEHNKYQIKWFVPFLSTFNFNIWYVHLLQQLQSLWHSVNIQYLLRIQHWCYPMPSATQAKGCPLNVQ